MGLLFCSSTALFPEVGGGRSDGITLLQIAVAANVHEHDFLWKHDLLVANEEVRAKIQQAIGSHDDFLIIVKKRKLQWYGDVSRSSGLAKNHLTRHSERGKKTRQAEEEVERQYQGMNGQAWSSPSPRGHRRTVKIRGNWL